MPQLDGRGPAGAGAMAGRRMGRCSPSHTQKADDEVKRAIAGLVAVVIIGVTEMVWSWIREKRLKSGSKQI